MGADAFRSVLKNFRYRNGGFSMKRVLGFGLVLALFSLPLFAAKNSHVFTLPSGSRIGDVQLPADCLVTWTEASGSRVQLTIKTKDNKTITVPARVVQEKRSEARALTSVENGVRRVKEFQTKEARFIIQDPQNQDAQNDVK